MGYTAACAHTHTHAYTVSTHFIWRVLLPVQAFKHTSKHTSFHRAINMVKCKPEPSIETQMCFGVAGRLAQPQGETQKHNADVWVKRLSQLVHI